MLGEGSQHRASSSLSTDSSHNDGIPGICGNPSLSAMTAPATVAVTTTAA
jgi:hypothetical protein